jgi:hypothetical protein
MSDFTFSTTDEPISQPDDLAQITAWMIVAAFGLWGAWGWLADGITPLSVLLAVVFGLFQISTNILAVKVRELCGRGAVITGIAAGLAMISTGLLSHKSYLHAYAQAMAAGHVTMDPQIMAWLLIAAPFLEPLLFWIDRLLREPRPAGRRANRVGVLTALGLWLWAPAQATAMPAIPQPGPSPVARPLPKAQARNLQDQDRARARLMIRQGQSPIEVHRLTGVPHSTVKRWARELR